MTLTKLEAPYILDAPDPRLLVLEIGGNPCGNRDLFTRMVREAAGAGAPAVKFQAFKVKSFVHPSHPSYKELLAEESPFPLLEDMMDLAHDLGLLCGITVFGEEGLCLALEKKADFIKISSGDITYLDLIRKASQTGLPLVISTGASHEFEVKNALSVIPKGPDRRRVFVLQCVSLYPAPPGSINLAVMKRWLSEGKRAGLSDHSLGVKAALAAFDLGAKMVERHFTTDRSLPGGDNAMSMVPKEARKIVSFLKSEEDLNQYVFPLPQDSPLWGKSSKKPVQGEYPDLIRRGALASKKLYKGNPINYEDLYFLRFGESYEPLVGPDLSLRDMVLLKDLRAGEPVFLRDLKKLSPTP
jgi:sialic acid synthase SpsE